MKKNEYQAPKMVAVKLNKKPTLLSGSDCPSDTSCTGESAGGGSECFMGG